MPDTPEPQAIALFRYGLIADFIHQPLGSPGLYARLREKAAADYTIPGSSRVRVAPRRCATGSRPTGAAASTRWRPRAAPTGASPAHCPRRWPMRC